MGKQTALKILGLLLFPILGMWILASATSLFRLGVAPDSISYLSVAQHLAHGRGVQVFMRNYSDVSEPVAAWPPGLPLLLVPFILLKTTFRDSTWWVNVSLYGLNILVLSAFVWKHSRNYLLAFITALALSVEQSWLLYHAYILAEPLNLLLINLSLFFLWIAVENRQNKYIFLSILFVGMATLTRYVSIAHCVSGGLTLLLLWPENKWEKIKKMVLYGILSFLPFALWTVRNVFITRKPGASIKEGAYGSLIHDQQQIYNTVWQNISVTGELLGSWSSRYLGMPWQASTGLIVGVFLLYCVTRRKFKTLPIILLISMFCYFAVLLLMLWVTKFAVPVPERYIITILCQLFVFIVIAGYDIYLFCVAKSPKLKPLILAALIVFSGYVGWHRYHEIRAWQKTVYDNGIDESWGMRWGFVDRMQWLPNK